MDLFALKRKLKSMPSYELRILLDRAELDETEKWLLRYAFIDNRQVKNTCIKLNISESTYHRMLPVALTKVYYTLKFT